MMKKFALLLLGAALLPLAWALSAALAGLFAVAVEAACGDPLTEVWAFLAGMVVFAAVWMVMPRPVRMYVLGHELTHALTALLFGARVSKLRVGSGGGSVQVSKSNVWITLSPYFFPFYAMALIAALSVAGIWFDPLPARWLWIALVGFAWAFHAGFTLRSLMQRQPDIVEYGRLFSYTLICIMNVAVLMIMLVCATGAGWDDLWRISVQKTGAAYAAVGSLLAKLFAR